MCPPPKHWGCRCPLLCPPSYLYECWEFKYRSLCLCGTHFSSWAISPVWCWIWPLYFWMTFSLGLSSISLWNLSYTLLAGFYRSIVSEDTILVCCIIDDVDSDHLMTAKVMTSILSTVIITVFLFTINGSSWWSTLRLFKYIVCGQTFVFQFSILLTNHFFIVTGMVAKSFFLHLWVCILL